MFKLISLRKFIPSSFRLSEFSLNLLSLEQRRTSCIVSWSVDAPNFGTIFETVVSSANFHMEERLLLTDHNQKEPWANPAVVVLVVIELIGELKDIIFAALQCYTQRAGLCNTASQ